ncbi:MAG: YihY/virulence factor BrkB family protein [Flavobacteriales bacterium]|nr:YihY/virulence factor BrkB family protein [Flavobacteriales bacterium]
MSHHYNRRTAIYHILYGMWGVLMGLWAHIRRMLYSVKVSAMGRLSLYRILALYGNGLLKGTLAARAESIAYSFFMAMFPGVIFIFSLIAYIPIDGLQETLMELLEEALPPHTWETVASTVHDIVSIKRGGLLSVSFVGVIFFVTNGVNGLIANFKTSYNQISMRPYINQYLVSLNLIFMLFVILVITLSLIIFSKVFWSHMTSLSFLGIEVTTIISIARYSLVFFAILLSVSLIFYYGPKTKGLPFFSPGAILSTILILISSYAFAFYIETFSQYNRLYGSLGAILIFMFWLFINSFLLLVGFELNAAIIKSINTIKKRSEI